MPKNLFQVTLSTDSLSYPRPWNQKLLDDDPDRFFSFKLTYPYLLQQRLRQLMPNRDVTVTNLGRRAVTIANLKNVGRDLLAWMATDIVVIHHGIVDCWIRDIQKMERRTNEEEFQGAIADLLALREKIAPTVPVIFIQALHTNQHMLNKVPVQNDIIDIYNGIIHESTLHDENLFEVIWPTSENRSGVYIHEDGQHLSRKGHEYLAQQLASVIVDIRKSELSRSSKYGKAFYHRVTGRFWD